MGSVEADLGLRSGAELALLRSADGNPAASIEALQAQIDNHKKVDASQSYLGKAFNAVYRSDEKTLKRLETELQSAKASGKLSESAQEALNQDRKALSMQGEITHYGTGFTRTAFLFMNGQVGLVGTMAVGALNEMKPTDSLGLQAVDGILGATKGGVMKTVFNVMGSSPQVDIFTKGVGLSLASRIVDTGLTRTNYFDTSGKFSTDTAWKNFQAQALDMKALGTDALVYAAGSAGINMFKIGTNMSPFMSTVSAGGVFGFTNGVTNELFRQQRAGEEFNVNKLLYRGALQGGLDALAATAGGIQNQRIFNSEVKLIANIEDSLKKEVLKDGQTTVVREYRTPAVEATAEQMQKSTPVKLDGGKTVTVQAGDWVVKENGKTVIVSQEHFPQLYEPMDGKPNGFWFKPQYMWVAELEKAVSRRDFTGQLVEGKPGDKVVVSSEGRLAKILSPDQVKVLQSDYPRELSPRLGADIGISLGALTNHPDPAIRQAATEFNGEGSRDVPLRKAIGTLDQIKAQHGENSPEFADRLKLVGRIVWELDPVTTLGLYQTAADIQLKINGNTSKEYGGTMHDMGFLLRALGRPVAAENAFSAYHTAMKTAGVPSPEVVTPPPNTAPQIAVPAK